MSIEIDTKSRKEILKKKKANKSKDYKKRKKFYGKSKSSKKKMMNSTTATNVKSLIRQHLTGCRVEHYTFISLNIQMPRRKVRQSSLKKQQKEKITKKRKKYELESIETKTKNENTLII